LLASGSFDGLVRLWDVASGRQLLALMSLPPTKEASWLAMTPEGYIAMSDDMQANGEWRMSGSAVPAWPTLTNPEMILKAMRAETIALPEFKK
jgi:WD40 repeat protein